MIKLLATGGRVRSSSSGFCRVVIFPIASRLVHRRERSVVDLYRVIKWDRRVNQSAAAEFNYSSSVNGVSFGLHRRVRLIRSLSLSLSLSLSRPTKKRVPPRRSN